jgi:hypothetical protein
MADVIPVLERTIVVTSRDPAFVTADIKAKLRRKNMLMHAGRVEEADSLAQLIVKDIRRHRVSSLSSLDYKSDDRQVWRVVCELMG